MIRISRNEHALLAYAQTDSPDLSRDNLATVADVSFLYPLVAS